MGRGAAALQAAAGGMEGTGLLAPNNAPPAPPSRATTTAPPPRSAPGSAPREAALRWAGLVGQATTLGALHWSRQAAAALVAGSGGGDRWPPPPPPCTARSGHAAVISPTSGRIIITGGVRRDGGTVGGLDVVVVDPVAAATTSGSRGGNLALTTAVSPSPPPPGRFRHAAVFLDPRTCPCAASALATAGAPPTADAQAAQGDAILIFGGTGADGREHGGGGLVEAAWVSRPPAGGGAGGPPPTVRWASIVAGGAPPASRYHHTADAFTCAAGGGAAVVVFGGDGARIEQDGGGRGGGGGAAPTTTTTPPLAHILNLATLTWRSVRTVAGEVEAGECEQQAAAGRASTDHRLPTPAHPGARSLHLSTVRTCPHTAHPQLVIIGGYAAGGLAPMTPWVLDVASLKWSRTGTGAAGPPVSPSPGRRQRAAGWRAGPDWLVIYGGSPAAGGFLGDVWALHLPTLAWVEVGAEERGGRLPAAHRLALSGRPDGPRRVAGHTLAGGVAFGGCVPTLAGMVPVAKCDVLLVGSGGGGGGSGGPPGGEGEEKEAVPEPTPAPGHLTWRALASRLAASIVSQLLRPATSTSGPPTEPLRALPGGGVLAGEDAILSTPSVLDSDGLTPVAGVRHQRWLNSGACVMM